MSGSAIAAAARARIAAARPDATGALAGVVATLLVELGAGCVVSADAPQELAQTRVNAMATVCAHNAREYWTDNGRPIKALEAAECSAVIGRCDEVMTEAFRRGRRSRRAPTPCRVGRAPGPTARGWVPARR